ncbi:MAG: SH3 domain-containing protein [Methyloceanibacter sp.]|uniref:SH3 domain-containing protein n=1 Tax=Methyloceanibacter sp. TaxID=1965321 RepID=UPI003D9AF704
MSRFLLCVWLAGAALYTAATLPLAQSLHGHGMSPDLAVNETVRAKHPFAKEVILPLTLPPEAATKRRIEWVQAARYMAVVRAQPSAASPVLFASTYGRPLRVIGREADFVRVQDLGSGQLGWIEARAISRFIGGYRQREVTPPVVVAESQVSPEATPQALLVATAPEAAATDSKPLARATLSRPKPERVATSGLSRNMFRKNRAWPQRVADRRHGGFAGIMQRALFGRL